MSILFKSIIILTVFSLIAGSNSFSLTNTEIFSLAEKLSELFNAFSNNQLTWKEYMEIGRFQSTFMNSWQTIMNAIENLGQSKTLDAYIALVNNKRELLTQILSIFNLGELDRFSNLVANILNNVNNGSVNCNETSCSFTTSSWQTNDTYPYYNTTWYPTWFTSVPSNISTDYWNVSTWVFENYTTPYPFYNSTDFFGNNTVFTSWFTSYPQNYTDFSTWLSTLPQNNTNFTSWLTSIPQNFTDFSTWVSTFPLNNTNYTTWFTPSPQNFTSSETVFSTGTYNATTFYPNNDTTVLLTTPGYNNGTTANSVFIDSEFCQYYNQVDCGNRVEISLLCPAMCRCSSVMRCQNNGTLALGSDGNCKCICKSQHTGMFCESNVCGDKEYCNYFNDSYCEVSMIYENCPSLCKRC